ncbi:hypothetical protein DCO58_05610 [Helicobacter saguini]|uniref:Outer membrane protein beta-barrel domain-containing protein n=1 Tax=Helicobacter saguini TaxID=1548018 RepID=A0A347VTA7_9HELI|nr:hypothetical protein [Helicobacter saguini]MWV62176.1 hypothetical protein [Helicobacter saguini]MWV67151.1 hypothetical protein [Helicobacter saguini]MWV69503.1 hypothetical protein [Helicobacter saguini]MWV70946.1 hypothetical protein [Helicobacter saguini]TLD92521.1 hypothetical protein LS64_010035 [Helicobacter saguini]
MQKVKKITLSLVLVAGFSGVASAYCTTNVCNSGLVAIGGNFNSLGGSAANMNAYGGYLRLGYESVFVRRYYVGTDGVIGGGVSNASGGVLGAFKKSSPFVNFEWNLRAGLNVFTDNAPLFINALVGVEKFMRSGVERTLYYVGAEARGQIPFNAGKGNVLYGAGYSFVIGDSYTFKDAASSVNAPISGFNYGIQAHLGVEHLIGERISFFSKIIGKYYALNSSKNANFNGADISYPATNSYNIMLEIGINGF